MKAIILAGGEGTRLRPLSCNKPKPMIRLFDRPLLEHIVLLLKRCGFTELCMTLHYLPKVIKDYFGDGRDWGVRIEYRTETQPAGTAGSVRACRDFAGNEDILVISGDAACSYDLRAMMEQHRLSGADATILVRKSDEPSEFGLVLADEDGFIGGFVEKPGPERVVSDLINTGIYVLSPDLLAAIPEGRSVDFGGEFFPKMLRSRRRLRVWQAEGYWNDVGSCEAYRATCRDVLDGLFPLPVSEGQALPCHAPCWISPEARVEPGAELGPYTVIGSGSTVHGGCRLSGCVLDGAYLQTGCVVENSVLSRGVKLGREVQIRSGCVLAEGVTVGDGSQLRENLRIWPGLVLPSGSILTEDLHCFGEAKPLRFRVGASLFGENRVELTPERLLRMGQGCGALRVGAAACGGYAGLLAESFLVGAASAGKKTFLMDAPSPAASAALSGVYDLDLNLYFRQDGGQTTVCVFDKDGLPVSRRVQRQLEGALSGAAYAAPTENCYARSLLTGTDEAYLAAALRASEGLDGKMFACPEGLLSRGLKQAGAEILPSGEGIPALIPSEDGFTLEVVDERGRVWPWDMLLCAWTAAEMQSGAQAVVLPYDAPQLAEQIAVEHSGTVYRLERDGEDARRLWRQAPWCRDALFLSVRMFSLLHRLGQLRFAEFMEGLPAYHRSEQVIQLTGADTPVLRSLSRDKGAETVNGIRLFRGEASATIRRMGGGALRILAESSKMEAAAEFCDSLQHRIRSLDSGNNS